MTNLEKARLFYDFVDLISNYDFSDCKSYDEFITKLFYIVKQKLEEEEEIHTTFPLDKPKSM